MDREKEKPRKSTLGSMMTAVALLAAGLGLVGWPEYTLDLVTIIAGIYMFLNGLLRILDAALIRRASRNGTPVSVEAVLIFAVFELIAGAVCGLSRFFLPDRMLLILGITLMVYGLVDLITAVLVSLKRRKAGNTPPEAPHAHRDKPEPGPILSSGREFPLPLETRGKGDAPPEEELWGKNVEHAEEEKGESQTDG